MKKIVPVILLFVICFQGFAQHSKSGYTKSMGFDPDTYFGVSLGSNLFIGEGVGSYLSSNAGKAVGNSFGLIYGGHISPLFGLRFSMGNVNYYWPNEKGNLKLASLDLTLQSTWSLSYVIMGYDIERKFSMDYVLGAGALYRYEAGTVPPALFPKLNTGIQFNYNLSTALVLHLITEVNFTNDTFNTDPLSGTNGVPVDIMPELKLSLTYNVPVTGGGKIYKVRGRH